MGFLEVGAVPTFLKEMIRSMEKEPEYIWKSVRFFSQEDITQVSSCGAREEEISLLQIREWDKNHYEDRSIIFMGVLALLNEVIFLETQRSPF